jgi:hypothetical protein
MALATDLGMRPLVARCRAGLATLYRRMARKEDAARPAAPASAMLREIDMCWWLERMESELIAVDLTSTRT